MPAAAKKEQAMQLYIIQEKNLASEDFDRVFIYADKAFYDEELAELTKRGFAEVPDEEDGSPSGTWTMGGSQLYESMEEGEEWFYFCGPIEIETKEARAARDAALAEMLKAARH
jgi:hypothetical protein